MFFVRGVIFNWGNFASCFFQSIDKWVYAFNRNIFIFKFYILLFFYIKILFSLASTYDISFLQIHTTIFFSFSILVHYKCQSKMNNLCFISNSVKGLQAISKRKKITSLQMVSFFFKKHNLPLEMRRYGMMNLEDSYSLMVKPILVVLLLVLLVQRL